MHTRTIFEEEKVAEERTSRSAETPLPVRSPDIDGVADRFFRTVVKVVAKRRPYLRFELERTDEMTARYNDEVPLSLRSIIAGQFQTKARFDRQMIESCVLQNIDDQHLERAHLGATGNGAASTGIYLAAFDLLLLLMTSRVPITLNGTMKSLFEVQ